MLQIIEVVVQAIDHLFDGVGVAVIERCIRGDTGTNLIEIRIAVVFLHDLVDVVLAFRARTDEGHVAAEDIPKLWEFVKMVLAQHFPDLGQAVVGFSAGELRTAVFGVDAHGAEFEDVERFAVKTYALLLIDGRTAVFKFDSQIAKQNEGRKSHETNRRHENVERPLGKAVETVHPIGDHFIFFFSLLHA